MFSGISIWAAIAFGCIGVVIVAFLVYLVVRFMKMGASSGKNQNDNLTGIGNKKFIRVCYYNRINLYLKQYCLIYLAFDSVAVSRKHGVAKVQELEKFTAKAIAESLGSYDYAARTDDGVFNILSRSPDMTEAEQKTASLVEMLNRYEYQLLGEHVVSFAAGIYALGEEGETFETASMNAKIGYDHAYETKINYCTCTTGLLRAESTRKRLKNKLLSAIDRSEFDPFIQFIYDARSRKFVGGEVLSRWNDPIEGFVMPAHYIGDMRNTGVINRLDYYMLDRTCKILDKWKKEGKDKLKLSCNLTRITISDIDFVDRLNEIAGKYDFDHSLLILEITEDALVDTTAVAYCNVLDCKEAGFTIAIDDFGAGHTSFSDLCDYPVDIIKVDRSLVLKTSSERGKSLVKGLIQLAHDLKMEVVCEGVETEQQNDDVIEDGTDYVQGYYHSYVFPLHEADEYFDNTLSVKSKKKKA